MRFEFVTVITFAALATLSGCASTTRSPAQTSPDRIGAAEIASSQATNAYELVTRLRPNWLRRTTAGSMSGGVVSEQAVVVYIDGSKFGDIVSLRALGVAGIRSIQWLDAVRAGAILPNIGSEPISGAIVISTR